MHKTLPHLCFGRLRAGLGQGHGDIGDILPDVWRIGFIHHVVLHFEPRHCRVGVMRLLRQLYRRGAHPVSTIARLDKVVGVLLIDVGLTKGVRDFRCGQRILARIADVDQRGFAHPAHLQPVEHRHPQRPFDVAARGVLLGLFLQRQIAFQMQRIDDARCHLQRGDLGNGGFDLRAARHIGQLLIVLRLIAPHIGGGLWRIGHLGRRRIAVRHDESERPHQRPAHNRGGEQKGNMPAIPGGKFRQVRPSFGGSGRFLIHLFNPLRLFREMR